MHTHIQYTHTCMHADIIMNMHTYIAWNCIICHYITSRYVTLHPYVHTSQEYSSYRTYISFFAEIHTYLHMYIHTLHIIHTYVRTYVRTYITLHYITLHYITLHYIKLHYITLHHATLHAYTHTVHTYMHACRHNYEHAYIHCIPLHYISLHHITLRYITSIRSYIT